MIRCLHTSDWHLGQKLMNYDREEEHRRALSWLLRTLTEKEIQVLIVSGDIFDIGSPPNYARQLYYEFLASLRDTPCRQVIITGGNHDSPSMLNASRSLLKALKIHVVGGGEAELIPISGEGGKKDMLVVAAPFFRDRDLRHTVYAETHEERVAGIRQALRQTFAALAEEVEATYPDRDFPVIATAHLYVRGAESAEKQDNIYLGDVQNLETRDFPSTFDYVALGHIHRPQAVDGKEHIRYSGSLIPLDFSETKDDKEVVVTEWEGRQLVRLERMPVPLFRRLKTIEGEPGEIADKLRAFQRRYELGLPAWVELVVHTDQGIRPDQMEWDELVKDGKIEIVRTRVIRSSQGASLAQPVEDLQNLRPLDVFERCCQEAGLEEEEIRELRGLFLELNEDLHAHS